MVDQFEESLKLEIGGAKASIKNDIQRIRDILDSTERRIENDYTLNDLGVLQSSGTILDANIARLATLQNILLQYRKNGPSLAMTRKEMHDYLNVKKKCRDEDTRCDQMAQGYQLMRDTEIELLSMIFGEEP